MRIAEAYSRARTALAPVTLAQVYDGLGDTAAPAAPAIVMGLPTATAQQGQCAWLWEVPAQVVAGSMIDRDGLLAIAQEAMDACSAAGLSCTIAPDPASLESQAAPAMTLTITV